MLAVCWHVAIVRHGRDETLGVALAQLVDVCLVHRDGLLHRLVQNGPLVVGTNEAVIRCERITLPQGLDNGGDFQIRLLGTRDMTLEVRKRRPIAMMD